MKAYVVTELSAAGIVEVDAEEVAEGVIQVAGLLPSQTAQVLKPLWYATAAEAGDYIRSQLRDRVERRQAAIAADREALRALNGATVPVSSRAAAAETKQLTAALPPAPAEPPPPVPTGLRRRSAEEDAEARRNAERG